MWCVTKEQEERYKIEERIYEDMWHKANMRTNGQVSTTLNKEMAKAQKNLTIDEKTQHVQNKLDYLYSMFEE